MAELVESRRDGRVLHLALNRPEKRNALNLALCRELATALEDGAADPKVGAILLKGNGKSFCAGMDLNEILEADTGTVDRVHEELFTFGWRVAKPVVAAVHGAALAGGTGLVANCHVVVAAEDATFGLTEIRLGLWPLVIFRAMAVAVGERNTTEMALTGRIFDAGEALRRGLVHYVVPAPEVENRAAELAAGIAAFSPTAVSSGLFYAGEARGKGYKEAGEIARRVREDVFASADFREGVRAFREKRTPRWPSLE
jgi:enoyl-CoA hydratase/carnithine racemase